MSDTKPLTLDTVQIIADLTEERNHLREQRQQLLKAANVQLERRRAAEKEAALYRAALKRLECLKHYADRLGKLPYLVMSQIVEAALEGKEEPDLWSPNDLVNSETTGNKDGN